MHRHMYELDKTIRKDQKRRRKLEKEIMILSKRIAKNEGTYRSEKWMEMKEMEINKKSKRESEYKICKKHISANDSCNDCKPKQPI